VQDSHVVAANKICGIFLCTSGMRKATQIRKSFQRPKFWVMGFGWCLAACAGAANTIAFKSWHLYASHVTGSTSAMAFRLEGYHQGEWGSETGKF